MTAQEYIQSQLQHCANYTLTDTDQVLLEKQGLEAFLYGKLTSKKFRKWTIDEISEKQVKRAITLAVAGNKPLQFRYPFGGYKLWSMPGSPEVDWAEFFSIAYYCSYLAPLAAVYEPGIELLFASDDVIIERMDNVPASDTDAYFSSFKKLLGAFRQFFPSNFKMDIVRVGDLYEDKDVMEQELAENIERVKREFVTMDPVRKEKMLTSSAMNIQWKGAKDLTERSQTEKDAVIAMGPVYHDAYCALSKRQSFNRGEDKIVLFTTAISKAIAIGTTKASITKFWTGFGVLEADKDSFKARILSPTQLEQANTKRFSVVTTDLFGLRNFGEIRVYQEGL